MYVMDAAHTDFTQPQSPELPAQKNECPHHRGLVANGSGSLRQNSGAFFTKGGSSWSVGCGQGKAGFSTWWKRQTPIDSASPEKSCLVSESVFQHLLCPIHSLDLETRV